MYKKIGIATLIIAPLVADFASRHMKTPDAAMPTADMGNPAAPPVPPPAMQQATIMNAPVQPQNLVDGIDPTPALDPTPPDAGPGQDASQSAVPAEQQAESSSDAANPPPA